MHKTKTISNRYSQTLQKGHLFEQQAAQFLINQGLRLLMRNYHSRWGEIDLIMLEHISVIFVEVRYRAYTSFGNAASTITLKKQQKIINTAQDFLNKYESYQSYDIRFDVMCVDGNSGYFNWIKHAFEVE